MNNFWKWFTNKKGFTEYTWVNHCRENWKLSLIGHMEEYMAERGYGVGNHPHTFHMMREGKAFGDIRYEQMVDEINRWANNCT